jgi:hypothetical protein
LLPNALPLKILYLSFSAKSGISLVTGFFATQALLHEALGFELDGNQFGSVPFRKPFVVE